MTTLVMLIRKFLSFTIGDRSFQLIFFLTLLSCTIAHPIDRFHTFTKGKREVNIQFRYSRSRAANVYDGIGAGIDKYKTYTGTGSPEDGWPIINDWVSFADMFNKNLPIMRTSCSNLGMPTSYNPSDSELKALRNAIQYVAYEARVDHRFILAIVMQESLGCVRVYTTNNGVVNRGMLQGHAGNSTCNSGTLSSPGKVLNPCPDVQIYGMIQDGVGGTMAGDGLAAILNTATTKMRAAGVMIDGGNARTHYIAARQYNSGSVNVSNLGYGFTAVNCYASDIANRLTGWTKSANTCTL